MAPLAQPPPWGTLAPMTAVSEIQAPAGGAQFRDDGSVGCNPVRAGIGLHAGQVIAAEKQLGEHGQPGAPGGRLFQKPDSGGGVGGDVGRLHGGLGYRNG